MNTSGGRSQVLATLEDSLCCDSDIEFAVAFGSQVRGEPSHSSDFDLAVKFADQLSPHERFQKRCFLSGDLQSEEMPFVDLSDIEALPLDVAHDAVNGDFICGDEKAFRRFKAELEATFAEQRDEIRQHQREVIDRIAEESQPRHKDELTIEAEH
ncbi:nucleotidyltransferase domain-containing protein [Halomontanus rarus]|uniref:nucleotidyltransferase domain-containing protein n=1 Tax=Halomontanus rarus TaxID=3034020 RepID=UPI0023E838EC|nr:nucleotidyltransferase domain-containing protein [Halovivax sp. TS33]